MRPLFSLVDLSLFDTFSGFTLASIPASVSVSAVPVPGDREREAIEQVKQAGDLNAVLSRLYTGRD
jgi:hypothetical protein